MSSDMIPSRGEYLTGGTVVRGGDCLVKRGGGDGGRRLVSCGGAGGDLLCASRDTRAIFAQWYTHDAATMRCVVGETSA
jgi:hypothetical protein